MLERDPSKRATATEVLNHEWVKENGVAGDVEIEPEVRSTVSWWQHMQQERTAQCESPKPVVGDNLPAWTYQQWAVVLEQE